MKARSILITVLAIQLISLQASGGPIDNLNNALRNFAAALALFMLTILGLKWIMSETPAERAEAKKGIIYIILGLLVVYLAANIVCGIYGSVLRNYGVFCNFNPATFTCDC